ncbi:MAG TPA: 4'-phosphopantetheinyl transferase superfamily protein, partial [Opitutaceae bacterium]|nr:4'-phosphopantetheinyl transferase superfamily protein [Opitutaceae bacterium]
EEVAELRALPNGLRRLGFFLCWTRKEAYVKAKAFGLQIPLDRFSVSLTPGQPAEIRGTGASRWTILSFEPEPGHVAAVVAEGEAISVKYCDYVS